MSITSKLLSLAIAGTAALAFTAQSQAVTLDSLLSGGTLSATKNGETLTFSDFSLLAPLNIDPTKVLITESFNVPGTIGFMNIGFNGSAIAPTDLGLLFVVSSSKDINVVDMGATGTEGFNIVENVYDDATFSPLGQMSLSAPNTHTQINIAPHNTIDISKDIALSNPSDLSVITQSFHFGSVPEPMTLSLIPLALAGMGLRKKFAK
jgi:hypothetical protein